MRQVMPHRNNIAMHRTKCKRYFWRRSVEGVRMGSALRRFRAENRNDPKSIPI